MLRTFHTPLPLALISSVGLVWVNWALSWVASGHVGHYVTRMPKEKRKQGAVADNRTECPVHWNLLRISLAPNRPEMSAQNTLQYATLLKLSHEIALPYSNDISTVMSPPEALR